MRTPVQGKPAVNMDKPPLVMVCGLGRSGSSLMMQMLAACGLRCAGTFPDFEPAELIPHPQGPEHEDAPLVEAKWLTCFGAVKMLVPHQIRFERNMRAMVIWLDRDPVEQAKSQLKLLANSGIPLTLQPGALARLTRQLRTDRGLAIEAVKGWPRIEANFEELVTAPQEICSHIADFAEEFGISLDPAMMAMACVDRTGECAKDMSMEMNLIKSTGAASVYQ